MGKHVGKGLARQLFAFVIIILCSLILAFILTTAYVKRSVRNNITEMNQTILEQTNGKIEDFYETMNHIAAALVYSPVTTSYYDQNNRERVLSTDEISATFSNTVLLENNIAGIYLFDMEKNQIASFGANENIGRFSSSIRNQMECSNQFYLDSSQEGYYLIYYPVYNLDTLVYGKQNGMAVFLMKSREFDNMLKNSQATKNTEIYLLDAYSSAHEIEMLAKAIEKSQREIVLSLSPGPARIERAWHYEKYANMWRITDDFWDDWKLLAPMFWRCELWQNHVEEGSYPDCDMLPLGKVGKGFREERSTKFTKDEQMTMMTLWCIFGSPLMIGAELTQMDPWTLSLLTKEEILKMVSNDFVGKQLERDEDHAVWSCYNKKTDEKYVAYFNLKEEKQTITADWNQIAQFTVEKDQKVREIWSEENTTVEQGILSVDVEAHGVKLYSCQ